MNSFWNYFCASTNYDLVGIGGRFILDFGCLILQIIDEDFELGAEIRWAIPGFGIWGIIFPLEKQIIDLKYLVFF